MGKQWQDTYGDFSYSEQWPHWKGQGKQHAPWRGKGKDNASNSGRKQDKAGPSFPKYDGTEPKQILLVAEKKDEQDSIVKSMQKAVTTARKAEAKTRKIQEELAHKERCWASYQQDLRNTYKTEQQRFLQDSARLKEELAEALIQEKQAKAQLSASGDDPFDAILQDPIRSSVMTPEKPAHSSRRMLDLDTASEEELRQALLAKMSKSGVAAEKAVAPASTAARQTSNFATPRQESRTEGGSVASHLTTPEASVAAAYYGGPTPPTVKDPYMASPSQSLHGTGRTPPSRQAHLQRSADGSGRVPVKQAGKQPPVSRQVAAGKSLAEKLERRRRQVEGLPSTPLAPPAEVSAELDEVLKNTTPRDLPPTAPCTFRCNIFDDDEESLESLDSEQKEWIKSHSSDLPALD